MRYVAILLVLTSVLTPAIADDPAQNLCKDNQTNKFGEWRNNYHGVVDGKAVGMTLSFDGTEVHGQAFTAPDFRDVPVQGKLERDGSLTLDWLGSDGKSADVFHGKFVDPVYCDKLSGDWVTPFAGAPVATWALSLSDAIGDEPGANYYARIDVSDDRQVDEAALALQKAIVAKDKQAVAGMVEYPLSVRLGSKSVQIKDQKQFLDMYEQIFTPSIVADVAATVPHHMFAKYENALFTSTIWLDNRGRLHTIWVR